MKPGVPRGSGFIPGLVAKQARYLIGEYKRDVEALAKMCDAGLVELAYLAVSLSMSNQCAAVQFTRPGFVPRLCRVIDRGQDWSYIVFYGVDYGAGGARDSYCLAVLEVFVEQAAPGEAEEAPRVPVKTVMARTCSMREAEEAWRRLREELEPR